MALYWYGVPVLAFQESSSTEVQGYFIVNWFNSF